MYRIEIRFAGTGGQGMISVAIILGDAISLYDWKYATQTQSYGPESRGTAARADIVVSDTVIDYPKVFTPDILVIMSQGAWDKYHDRIKPNGFLFVDSTVSISKTSFENQSITLFHVPCIQKGESISKRPLVSNIVMLGVVVTKTKIVTDLAVRRSIQERWPKHANLNIRAFEEGVKLGNRTRPQIL